MQEHGIPYVRIGTRRRHMHPGMGMERNSSSLVRPRRSDLSSVRRSAFAHGMTQGEHALMVATQQRSEDVRLVEEAVRAVSVDSARQMARSADRRLITGDADGQRLFRAATHEQGIQNAIRSINQRDHAEVHKRNRDTESEFVSIHKQRNKPYWNGMIDRDDASPPFAKRRLALDTWTAPASRDAPTLPPISAMGCQDRDEIGFERRAEGETIRQGGISRTEGNPVSVYDSGHNRFADYLPRADVADKGKSMTALPAHSTREGDIQGSRQAILSTSPYIHPTSTSGISVHRESPMTPSQDGHRMPHSAGHREHRQRVSRFETNDRGGASATMPSNNRNTTQRMQAPVAVYSTAREGETAPHNITGAGRSTLIDRTNPNSAPSVGTSPVILPPIHNPLHKAASHRNHVSLVDGLLPILEERYDSHHTTSGHVSRLSVTPSSSHHKMLPPEPNTRHASQSKPVPQFENLSTATEMTTPFHPPAMVENGPQLFEDRRNRLSTFNSLTREIPLVVGPSSSISIPALTKKHVSYGSTVVFGEKEDTTSRSAVLSSTRLHKGDPEVSLVSNVAAPHQRLNGREEATLQFAATKEGLPAVSTQYDTHSKRLISETQTAKEKMYNYPVAVQSSQTIPTRQQNSQATITSHVSSRNGSSTTPVVELPNNSLHQRPSPSQTPQTRSRIAVPSMEGADLAVHPRSSPSQAPTTKSSITVPSTEVADLAVHPRSSPSQTPQTKSMVSAPSMQVSDLAVHPRPSLLRGPLQEERITMSNTEVMDQKQQYRNSTPYLTQPQEAVTISATAPEKALGPARAVPAIGQERQHTVHNSVVLIDGLVNSHRTMDHDRLRHRHEYTHTSVFLPTDPVGEVFREGADATTVLRQESARAPTSVFVVPDESNANTVPLRQMDTLLTESTLMGHTIPKETWNRTSPAAEAVGRGLKNEWMQPGALR